MDDSAPGPSGITNDTSPIIPDTVEENLQNNNELIDDIGEYYFESDHLAIQTNNEYKLMLRALALLESQRMQAIQDLDRLRELRKEALSDPILFVDKLQKGEELNVPPAQKIEQLPQINWSKYATTGGFMPAFHKEFVGQNWTKGIAPNDDDSQEGKNLIRGRPTDNTKTGTFNQLWTPEEQKRLEELLIEYPPEEIEAKRWKKIATALGNRTTLQVASRVQKFFIKLSKAGLPVPGRKPNLTSVKKNAPMFGLRNRGRPAHQLLHQFAVSSFFRHQMAPVHMPGIEQYPEFYSNCGSADEDSNDTDTREKEDQDDDPQYQELMFLKRLKEKKFGIQALAQHVGFKCDRCGCDPIIGMRWHCTDCPPTNSVDFCNDCIDCQHESGQHTSRHKMEAFKQAESSKPFLDRDYIHFMGGDYNYLDPNYMPAST